MFFYGLVLCDREYFWVILISDWKFVGFLEFNFWNFREFNMLKFYIVVFVVFVVFVFFFGIVDVCVDNYGVIVYFLCIGVVGWLYDYFLCWWVEWVVMGNCMNYVGDCWIVIYFINVCGVVVCVFNGGWGVDWGDDCEFVESNVLEVCYNYGDNCCIVCWVCISCY